MLLRRYATVNNSRRVRVLVVKWNYRKWFKTNLRLMIFLCTPPPFLSLFLSRPLLPSGGCLLLVLRCLVPLPHHLLLIPVSPYLCLHSRFRLSASSNSSSSSWPPREVQDPLHWCWAPGPQFLLARARGAWSSQASSESATAPPPWSVSRRCWKHLKVWFYMNELRETVERKRSIGSASFFVNSASEANLWLNKNCKK